MVFLTTAIMQLITMLLALFLVFLVYLIVKAAPIVLFVYLMKRITQKKGL